jgi:hypothetical protein
MPGWCSAMRRDSTFAKTNQDVESNRGSNAGVPDTCPRFLIFGIREAREMRKWVASKLV